MALAVAGQVGPQTLNDGATQTLRQGRSAEVIVQELHGRFYEQVYRGNAYINGTSSNALSANTITLTSTTTPILGVWNPTTSAVNVVLLQASLQSIINTFTTPVGAGVFVFATSTGNGAISTGTAPLNVKSLVATGSSAKGMAFVALTGLTNNLVIQGGIGEFTSPTGQTYGTIVAPTAGTSLSGFGGVWNIDGGIIVPPGGVFAILNTTSTSTMSATGKLLWEEVPL